MTLRYLIFISLLTAVICDWSNPVKILDVPNPNSIHIISSYRDSTTSRYHVLYSRDLPNEQAEGWHLIAQDDGKVIFNEKFALLDAYWADKTAMRSLNNGKNIFIAYQGYKEYYASFIESSDDGKTWSKPIKAADEAYFYDMIYIAETNRAFVFFSNVNEILCVSSKPADSTIFGNAHSIDDVENFAKASYNMENGKAVIHVSYIDEQFGFSYVKSSNNGVTWTEPKNIIMRKSINTIHQAVPRPDGTYFIYLTNDEKHNSQIVETHNSGRSFGKPVSITEKSNNSENNTNSFAYCNAKNNDFLTSFYISDNHPKYAIWDTKELKPNEKSSPFDKTKIYSAAISCYLTENDKVTTVFAYEEDGIYFAKETS